MWEAHVKNLPKIESTISKHLKKCLQNVYKFIYSSTFLKTSFVIFSKHLIKLRCKAQF